MIEFRNFSKKYNHNDEYAVKDISFIAEDCSITVIVGENGAGKSTILKAASLVHYPSKGNVFISGNKNGQIFDSLEYADCAKKYVSFVSENTKLQPDLYVSEYLKQASSLYNYSKHNLNNSLNSSSRKKLQEIVQMCELDSVLEKKVKALSNGYKKRLLLALALIPDAKNIVLDEPASALDPIQKNKFRVIIKNLAKTKTVLYSTHSLQDISEFNCKILVLSDGKIIADTSEKDLLEKTGASNLEKAFLKITKKAKS